MGTRKLRAAWDRAHDAPSGGYYWQVTHRYMGLEYLAKMTSAEETMTALAIAG